MNNIKDSFITFETYADYLTPPQLEIIGNFVHNNIILITPEKKCAQCFYSISSYCNDVGYKHILSLDAAISTSIPLNEFYEDYPEIRDIDSENGVYFCLSCKKYFSKQTIDHLKEFHNEELVKILKKSLNEYTKIKVNFKDKNISADIIYLFRFQFYIKGKGYGR